jgi:hypothetical protein
MDLRSRLVEMADGSALYNGPGPHPVLLSKQAVDEFSMRAWLYSLTRLSREQVSLNQMMVEKAA